MRLLSRPLKWFSVLNKKVRTQGFSIVELIVTISILVIINAVIFANYPKFRQSISLRRTSQEVASTIYQAQTYALSVKEFQGQFPGYGVRFDKTLPDSFVLFADLPEVDGKGNKKYDGDSEKVEEFKIQTSDRISELCGTTTGNLSDCAPLTTADIIFERPKAMAILTDGSGPSKLFANIKITIKSLQEQTKTINIWLSGQISVK